MPFSKEKFLNVFQFGLILGLAIFLRFYKIDQFQFDSDELSAIFRAQNAMTWQQHIQNGILIDGHPAGVQTFLWVWIRLFSDNPLPLKILTAILGILNVTLVFTTARQLFNQKSALFAMLCMATLWWQVDLSLWVRPYIFGQLFTLLSINLLNLGEPEKPLLQSKWILLSLCISAAFYIHYFAFLTVGLLCLSVFILQPSKRIQLLKSVGLFFLLAIPQMSIVLNQLKVGGLDWLGKPNLQFFYNHLIYNFNQSELLVFVILVFVAFGIFFIRKLKSSQNFNIATLLITLWISPIIIGYAYSIYSKPVLQNNVLFFSSPMLIIGLSYFYQRIPKYLFAFSIIFVGSISVMQIFKLKHRFDVEIKDVYASQIKTLNDSFNTNTQYFIDGPIDVFQYHESRQSKPINLTTSQNMWMMSKNNWNLHDLFLSLKKTQGKSTLCFISNAGTNPVIRPMLYDYFWCAQLVGNYIGGQIDEFDIHDWTDSNYLSNFISQEELMSNGHAVFGGNGVKIVPNTNQNFSFSSNYFKYGRFNRFSSIQNEIQPNDLIVIKVYSWKEIRDLKIVTAIINHDTSLFSKKVQTEQIDFRYTNCSDFWDAGFGNAYHVLKLSDIPNWNKNSELRITLETSNKSIPNIQISLYRFCGNPYQYGIN